MGANSRAFVASGGDPSRVPIGDPLTPHSTPTRTPSTTPVASQDRPASQASTKAVPAVAVWLWRMARDFAEVEGWVRLPARTSVGGSDKIEANDAGARRPGGRLQPGPSGFDSHRRLWVLDLRIKVIATGPLTCVAGRVAMTVLETLFDRRVSPVGESGGTNVWGESRRGARRGILGSEPVS